MFGWPSAARYDLSRSVTSINYWGPRQPLAALTFGGALLGPAAASALLALLNSHCHGEFEIALLVLSSLGMGGGLGFLAGWGLWRLVRLASHRRLLPHVREVLTGRGVLLATEDRAADQLALAAGYAPGKGELSAAQANNRSFNERIDRLARNYCRDCRRLGLTALTPEATWLLRMLWAGILLGGGAATAVFLMLAVASRTQTGPTGVWPLDNLPLFIDTMGMGYLIMGLAGIARALPQTVVKEAVVVELSDRQA